MTKLSNRLNTFSHNFMFSWHNKSRIVFSLGLITLEILFYVTWFLWVYYQPSLHDYVHFDTLTLLVKNSFWFLAIPFISLLVIQTLPQENEKNLIITGHIFIFIYSIFLGVLFHFFGQFSLIVGVSLAFVPLLNLLLFGQRMAFISFGYLVAIFFAVLMLISFGVLENASLVKQENANINLFWVTSFFYLSFFKMTTAYVLIDLFINALNNNDDQIKHLSNHDSLTQVLNRRAIMCKINKFFLINDELTDNSTQDVNLTDSQKIGSIIMVDVDDFKTINDTHGHLIGDKVLHEVATTIKDSIRQSDSIGRYGGEEFIILLEDCLLDQALFLAENIRQKLQDILLLDQHNNPVIVTASLGVASSEKIDNANHFEFLEDDLTQSMASVQRSHMARQVIDLADKALYKAKSAGRNKVYTLQNTKDDTDVHRFYNYL